MRQATVALPGWPSPRLAASWLRRLPRQRRDRLFDDLVGGDRLALGVDRQHQAVAQGGQGDRLDVVDREVVAALDQRRDTAREGQRLDAARTRPEADEAFHPVTGGRVLRME